MGAIVLHLPGGARAVPGWLIAALVLYGAAFACLAVARLVRSP